MTMSTRCQVRINQTGMGWDTSVTLYHHCDGYPSAMVPLIQKSYETYGGSWKAGRAGHAASYLIASDIEGYEPEDSHELHSDIEFYYVLELRNTQGGSCAENPDWHLTVYGGNGETAIASGLVHELDGEAIEKALA